MKMLHTKQGSLKLLGEHVALDLLNSTDIERGRPVDFLRAPVDLPLWAVAAGLLGGAAADELNDLFKRDSMLADATLADALALRSLLDAEISGPGTDPRALLELLNRLLPAPLLKGVDALQLNVPEAAPDRLLLGRLALFAADLLLCIPREQVRRCEAPECTWFFIDRSGGRRHWCLMQSCGNAAKARRHRERVRQRA